MHRFWHDIPARVNLANAQILKIDGQISKWNYGELDLIEMHDETLATLYYKYFYNTKFHNESDVLEVFQEEIARREALGPIGAEAGRGSFNFKDLTTAELELRAQRTKVHVEILIAVYHIDNNDIFYRLGAVAKVLEKLSDDEIAELCAVFTDRDYVDGSIWKEVMQVGLDRSSSY